MVGAQLCEYTEMLALYTCSGWTLCYTNCVSIKRLGENLVAPARPPGFRLPWAGTQIPILSGTGLPVRPPPQHPGPRVVRCGALVTLPVSVRAQAHSHLTAFLLGCGPGLRCPRPDLLSWRPVRSQLRCHLSKYLLSETGHPQLCHCLCFPDGVFFQESTPRKKTRPVFPSA